MQLRKVTPSQQGAVLLVVLVLVSMSTLGGLAMMRSALFHQRLDQVQHWQSATFEAAESALTAVAVELKLEPGAGSEKDYCHQAQGALSAGACEIARGTGDDRLVTEIRVAPVQQGHLAGFATDQVASQVFEAVATARWLEVEPESIHWQRWQRPQLTATGFSVSD